jgi:hypothetical protein
VKKAEREKAATAGELAYPGKRLTPYVDSDKIPVVFQKV